MNVSFSTRLVSDAVFELFRRCRQRLKPDFWRALAAIQNWKFRDEFEDLAIGGRKTMCD